MDERGNYGQLLLHAVRIAAYGVGQAPLQVEELRILADAVPSGVRAYTEYVRDEVEVLDACHELVQIRVVRYVRGDLLARHRLPCNGVAVYGYLTFVEVHYSGYCFKGGGLAGAVVAYESVDLARLDVEAQVVHGLCVSVLLGKMFDLKHVYLLINFKDVLSVYYRPPERYFKCLF